MKEKIANALKTKYANLGLSKVAFDGVAAILEKTITDEAGIEDAVSQPSVADLLKGLQSDFDKLRGEKSTAEKALADYRKAHPETESKVAEESPEATKDERIDALMAQMAQMQSEIAETRRADRVAKVTSEVDRLLKERGATNDYVRRNVLKGMTVGDEDSAEGLAKRYQGIYDAELKEAFGEGYVPPRGSSHQEGYKPGVYKERIEMLQHEGLLPSEKNKK